MKVAAVCLSGCNQERVQEGERHALSIVEKKSHDILNGQEGKSMLGLSTCVPVNMRTESILEQMLCEILQSPFSNVMKESELLGTYCLG